jgi:TRAP-type mannitol/chloroaromatic compound transport system substrate-binding protein
MTETNVSRRKFLKTGAIGAGAAAGALAMPSVVTAQSPIVLKMQSSWTATDIFQEMAQQYVERIHKMSNNRLQIDLLPAGAVVGAFDVQDACHDGALDAAHTVPVYWYGKHKGASLFGTGPVFGGTGNDMIAWFYQGGGKDFYRELVQDVLGLNLVGFYAFGMPAQPLGWFKNEITSADQLNGLKYRTVGLSADLNQAMGVAVTQLPGGEIVPAMDRGVIEAFEFNNPTSDSRFGAQDVAKNYMLGSYHQASESFEFIFNKDRFESLDPDLQAILEHGVEAMGTANNALAMNQYSADLQKLIEGGVNVKRTPTAVLEAQLVAWDKIIPMLEEDPFNKKVLDSQREWVARVGFYQIMNAPSYELAFNHYYPGKIPA